MKFTIARHSRTTGSTNTDARNGAPGEVYTADEQTAGRGRLDHSWHSAAGKNVIMSAVVSAAGLPPEHAATFPLAAGLATAQAIEAIAGISGAIAVKWPNDVLFRSRKIAGILCERNGENIICGIGVNVLERDFPEEIRSRATSFAEEGVACTVGQVRDLILERLAEVYCGWRESGFAFVHRNLAEYDFLKGRMVSVVQTDSDSAPVSGLCGGVLPDGALDVGGVPVFAGEAHVSAIG